MVTVDLVCYFSLGNVGRLPYLPSSLHSRLMDGYSHLVISTRSVSCANMTTNLPSSNRGRWGARGSESELAIDNILCLLACYVLQRFCPHRLCPSSQ